MTQQKDPILNICYNNISANNWQIQDNYKPFNDGSWCKKTDELSFINSLPKYVCSNANIHHHLQYNNYGDLKKYKFLPTDNPKVLIFFENNKSLGILHIGKCDSLVGVKNNNSIVDMKIISDRCNICLEFNPNNISKLKNVDLYASYLNEIYVKMSSQSKFLGNQDKDYNDNNSWWSFKYIANSIKSYSYYLFDHFNHNRLSYLSTTTVIIFSTIYILNNCGYKIFNHEKDQISQAILHNCLNENTCDIPVAEVSESVVANSLEKDTSLTTNPALVKNKMFVLEGLDYMDTMLNFLSNILDKHKKPVTTFEIEICDQRMSLANNIANLIIQLQSSITEFHSKIYDQQKHVSSDHNNFNNLEDTTPPITGEKSVTNYEEVNV